MDGTVIRVFLNKGYGFVRGEDGLSRMIHVNEFQNRLEFERLHEGQGVEFEPDDMPSDEKRGNGLRGKNIRVKAS